MQQITQHHGATLRLLAAWLPLAQAMNEEQGWGEDTVMLEQLIHNAGPLLQAATRAETARAMLLVYHAMMGMTLRLNETAAFNAY